MSEFKTVSQIEEFGRTRLSKTFFMRDFLYSDISMMEGIPNIPDDPALAIESGRNLCEKILEPIQDAFGRIAIRSAFRSCAVNAKGAENNNQYNCSKNENNYAGHIWDVRDCEGFMGATVCIVVPAFLEFYERTGDWTALAWWVHDHIPEYASQYYFPRLAAFNIRWSENPSTKKFIKTYVVNPHTGDKKALVLNGEIVNGLNSSDFYNGITGSIR
jgi:hypothetical protein